MAFYIFTGGEIIDVINNKLDISSLNSVVRTLYTHGVVQKSGGMFQVRKTSLNTVTILTGVAFFPNGSVGFLNQSVTLPYSKNMTNYIYLSENMYSNSIDIICSTASPSSEDVLLYELSSDGNLTDKRIYVRGKIPLNQL